jgi:hypothetical protein
MLNGLVVGYASIRALSLVSVMLATIDPTGLTHTGAHAQSNAESTERLRGRAETVCVMAETARRHIVTLPPSCRQR